MVNRFVRCSSNGGYNYCFSRLLRVDHIRSPVHLDSLNYVTVKDERGDRLVFGAALYEGSLLMDYW